MNVQLSGNLYVHEAGAVSAGDSTNTFAAALEVFATADAVDMTAALGTVRAALRAARTVPSARR